MADTRNHRIQQFDEECNLVSAIGKHGSAPGQFDNPTGLAFKGDKIYVADSGNGRIQILSTEKDR